MCSCPGLLHIDRGRGRVDHHCFRHGLSWCTSEGRPDFVDGGMRALEVFRAWIVSDASLHHSGREL